MQVYSLEKEGSHIVISDYTTGSQRPLQTQAGALIEVKLEKVNIVRILELDCSRHTTFLFVWHDLAATSFQASMCSTPSAHNAQAQPGQDKQFD